MYKLIFTLWIILVRSSFSCGCDCHSGVKRLSFNKQVCVIHNKQWGNKDRNILQYRSRDQWNGCTPIQLLIINQQHSFLWKEINGTRIIGKKSSMITFVPDMMKRLIKWINVFTLCKSNTVKFYQHASTVWYVIHKSQLFFVKKDFKRVRRKNLLFFKIRIFFATK